MFLNILMDVIFKKKYKQKKVFAEIHSSLSHLFYGDLKTIW